MADQRITQLNALSKAGVAATDVLPIADISASETKKVTAKDLVAAGIDLVDNGEIDLAKLDQSSTTKLGTTALADDAVTYAKIQNVSATDRLLGRSSAGAGSIEEITLTAAGRALLDDADAAAQRTTLGLGTLATQSGTFSGTHSGTSSGTNTGDQTITLTGDVTGSGTGSFAATISDGAVTYAKIQDTTATDVVLGRSSAGGGDIEEIACTAAGRALLDDANASAQRTTLGLGTLATQNSDAVSITGGTATVSSLTANSATISGGTISGITDLAVADGGTGASNAANARTNLGLAIGTDVQAYDAGLNSIAGLTTSADQTIYTTGSDTYAVTSLTAAGRALLDDADAAAQRTTLGLGSVATANQVSTAQIQDDAVTADKLANESTVDRVTSLAFSGAFIGQFALLTTTDQLYSWDGAQWVAVKAAGSINSITSDNTGIVNTVITQSGDAVTVGTSLDNTTGAAQFLAGPTSAAGSVGYRAIAGSDLPTATTNAKGGVVVNGNGLTMVSDTIAIDNTVTASGTDYLLAQYNANGLVVDGRIIQSSDLPVATDAVAGTVIPGSGLNVGLSGVLNHTNNVVAGTATKVTFDSEGHITASESLEASDIPNLDASKITSGTFTSTFLAPNSVTAEQLADYGIAQVSETAPTPEFAGQWWINPSDRSAYIWVGTVTPTPNGYWLLVGYGSPTQLNLRFGGTYNASTNTVTSLNQYGSEAGLTVGQALGAPNNQNNGVYLAVTTAGTGTTPAPAVSLSVGDWVLSQGTGSNWTKVAVVSGASGTFNDYDILCDGTYFTPDMTAVADVRDALELIWGRVQIATTSQIGVVKESTEILVDNSTGEMTVGVVDDGTY